MGSTNNLKDTNTKDLIKSIDKIKKIIQTQQDITALNDRINEWEARLGELRDKYYDLNANDIKYQFNNEIQQQKNSFKDEINNLRKWFWLEIAIGILAICGTFIFAIIKIPNEFIVKNNLSKEDIKDIIQYTYQQQVIKHK